MGAGGVGVSDYWVGVADRAGVGSGVAEAVTVADADIAGAVALGVAPSGRLLQPIKRMERTSVNANSLDSMSGSPIATRYQYDACIRDAEPQDRVPALWVS